VIDSQRFEVAVPETAAGERLDRFLSNAVPNLTRSRLKSLITGSNVSLDAVAITEPDYRVKPGQIFDIVVPEAAPAEPQPQAMDLEILYEDDDLIVVNKPAGLVVHPAPGNPDRTLVNALIAHCGPSLTGIGGVQRPGIVHRLDKDTSGAMVAAKTEAAHQHLVDAFASRNIERRYLALVWGNPRPTAGEISGHIGRSPRNRKKMAVLRKGGKHAVTRYKTLKSYADGAVSLVECKLLTGRTHQIRVHFSDRGHPIVGDPVYGRARSKRGSNLSAEIRNDLDALPRQALHAASLGFTHPTTHEFLNFEAALPRDISALVSSLERLQQI